MSKEKAGSNSFYPLKFEPVLRETIWGGDYLEHLIGREPSTSRQIGEAWIVWDGLAISNGAWRGRRLADVVKVRANKILGKSLEERYNGVFPLLVKLIDARDNLSVQVHPSDLYAQQREGQPFGKSEMWYVLDARPGASIIHGVRHRVDPDEVAEAAETAELGNLLESVPVKAGDVIYNPAGTVHALGKGTLIYELQQSSDLTYRLYDWGRKLPDGSSRELHIDKSVDVLIPVPFSAHKIRPVTFSDPNADRKFLCACKHFAAEWMKPRASISLSTQGRRFEILTALEGSVELVSGAVAGDSTVLGAGESALIPASLGDYEVRPIEPGATLIKSYVPDLLHDVVIPLRKQGIDDAEILQLGGDVIGNDLLEVLSPGS